MKKIIGILVIINIVFAACVKENTSEIPLNNTVDTTIATPKQDGIFMNGPYGMVSGKARVYKQNNQFILALENVSISNGPDLHVYISKEIMPVNFIDLGNLQSTIGNQLYAISGSPDFTQYKYALIHCQRYNHLFGSAQLQ